MSAALITDAELIIADEPTPGMSLEQALEALGIFREMADEGKGVILITHDIDLAFEFADRVAVFYAGTTVETAPASDFRKGPDALRHPYSKALWRALPQNGFQPIEGFQPYAGNLPKGCLFAPRCPHRTAQCVAEVPPVRKVRGGEVRKHFPPDDGKAERNLLLRAVAQRPGQEFYRLNTYQYGSSPPKE